MTGMYVCSSQKASKTIWFGVVCTDAVASAITLIMQSTCSFTLVHMTEKGSTIDPEGSNTKVQTASYVSHKAQSWMDT